MKLLYDDIPQVMLIQHNDTHTSTNIFWAQQSQVRDLPGMLWLKKLYVDQNKEWSATGTEQEENHGISV